MTGFKSKTVRTITVSKRTRTPSSMPIPSSVFDAFEAHVQSARAAHERRKASAAFCNVVDDRETRETLSVEQTLGRRQPQDVFAGDVHLRTMRTLLSLVDERGWERSAHQCQFHASFEKCVARVLYKKDDEWKTQRPAIMHRNNWDRCSSEVMISTPRRFGKTFSIAIFTACLALSVGCEIGAAAAVATACARAWRASGRV